MSSVIAALLELDTCAVSDALDSLGLPAAVTGLGPLTVARKIAGPVLTVKLVAGTPKTASVRHLGTAAIATASAGDVIVIEHSSGVECAGWGGVLSVGALERGVAGVVIDGPARDIDEARALAFPVYGRAATARTARGRAYEADFNRPITIGGITVEPGDLCLADSSGIAFISAAQADAVLRRARRIAQRERLMVEALRAGERITEVVGRDYEAMLDELE
jgi:4-hydroxy-4-methyl-2-oxoglutarate aldolase